VLAVTGHEWIDVVLALSATVPPVIAIALAWFFLRGARNDPDHQRLKRVQENYERSRRES
jgi:hypothetical protein